MEVWLDSFEENITSMQQNMQRRHELCNGRKPKKGEKL
jgi:hypothetical protein